MNKQLYLDTNVIMDFFLNRDSAAYTILIRALQCEFFIITSPLVIRELLYQGLEQETKMLINLLKNQNKVQICTIKQEHKREARKLQTHYADALHKVLAKSSNAVLVTKNTKDYPFTDIIVKMPDEI